MLETDSPYLTPRDLRPQPKARRNEPVVPAAHPAHRGASARANPPKQVAEETTRNARAFFGLHMNIAQFLLQNALRIPDRPAIAAGGKVFCSYRDLANRVARLASGLIAKFNLEPGDRVALRDEELSRSTGNCCSPAGTPASPRCR